MVNVTKLCLLATAWAGAVLASNTVTDGVRTIAGELVTVAAESELDRDGQTAGNVVLTEEGGIAFTQSLTGTANSLKKTYTLNGTGVVSVAAGQTVEAEGARLVAGAVGHTLVKRGPGTFKTGKVGTPAAAHTRFIVEEGMFQCRDGDFWGGHATANTNVTLDVREGAVYHHGGGHGVVGPVELTGGTFKSTPAAPEGRGQGAGLDGRPARRAGVAHGRRGGRNNQPARKSPVAHPRRHDPDPALAAPYRSDV